MRLQGTGLQDLDVLLYEHDKSHGGCVCFMLRSIIPRQAQSGAMQRPKHHHRLRFLAIPTSSSGCRLPPGASSRSTTPYGSWARPGEDTSGKSSTSDIAAVHPLSTLYTSIDTLQSVRRTDFARSIEAPSTVGRRLRSAVRLMYSTTIGDSKPPSAL